jgi:flavin reductase (DIM6/NTAB) family NADH-FMN oxidoreductase RutF
VSSIIVAEGDPPTVHFLCGPENDVWDRILDTGTFVVHVLAEGDAAVSDAFAGVRPAPGGPFRGLEVSDTPHGPVITTIDTRAACRYLGHRDLTAHALVEGAIDSVTVHDLRRPLGWFRGSYLRRGQGEGHS